MKHTKFSKIVSAVLVVCMMLSVVSVAAETTEPEVAAVTAVQDITSTKVSVSGKTMDINLAGITLVVLAPGIVDDPETETDEVKAIVDAMLEEGEWDDEIVTSVGQVFANADGSYAYEFVLAEEAAFGEYTLIATSNDVAKTTFYFASPTTRKEALADIIDATATEEKTVEEVIVEVIDEQGKNLGIDTEFWAWLGDDEIKEDAADAIKANEALKDMDSENLTAEDIAEAAKQIDAEALTAALNAGKVEDIADYEDKVEDKEAMENYKALSEDAKEYAMSLISEKDIESAADMEDDLAVAAKIAFMAVDGLEDLDKFGEYADDLDLTYASDFGKLTATQQRGVVNAVKDAKPTTISTLNTAFKKAVSSYDKSNATQGGGGNGKPTYITSGGKTEETDDNNKDSLGSETEIEYIDLGNHAWAEEAIYALSKKGILAGYGDGIFGPSNQIKREEFAKIIVAALYGEEAVNADKVPSFADAKNGWYTPFVGYAEGTGIVKGISETEFGVGKNIKRQDIMTILYRVMQAKGYNANTATIAYGDASEISDYAKDAVFALANAGVVGGYEDGYMRPHGEATRAEVAVMIYRFLNLFNN